MEYDWKLLKLRYNIIFVSILQLLLFTDEVKFHVTYYSQLALE